MNAPVQAITADDVQRLIDQGEGPHVEFKEVFPEQGRDLAKELAAFAGSGGGILFLGVEDDGTVAGIDASDNGRTLVSRIEGICSNTIRPNLRAGISIVEVEGKSIGVISVPAGAAPLYYVGNIPYLRHQTSSRPADPQEVIDAVLAWHARLEHPSIEERKRLGYFRGLLTEIILLCDFGEERLIDPWLSSMRASWLALAEAARNLAAEPFMTVNADRLREIAELLANAGTALLCIGSDGGMQELAEEAGRQARVLKGQAVDPFLGVEDRDQVSKNIGVAERKLRDLAGRLGDDARFRRTGDIQREAGQIGWDLRLAATAGPIDPDIGAVVDAAGRSLLEVETRTIYMDGGQSVDAICKTIKDAADQLAGALTNG